VPLPSKTFMAIVFLKKRKRQKYLLVFLVVLTLAIILIIWSPFKRGVEPFTPSEEVLKPREIKINFEILENPQLLELQPLPQSPPLEEEIGRGNPFLPY